MSYEYLGEPEATYRILTYRIDCPDPATVEGEEPRTINIMKEISITQKNGQKSIGCAWRLRGFWKQNADTRAEAEVNHVITMYQSQLYSNLKDGEAFEKIRKEIEAKIQEVFDQSEEMKKRNAVIVPQSTGMLSSIKQR